MFIRTESFREFIRFYPVVTAIVIIHIILYLLTSLYLFPNQLLLEKLSGVNLYIWEGEIWRLLTPIFIHGNFSHVLFNSFSVILFGPALEKMIGSLRFTLVYLVTGISANIATLFLEPVSFVHVGASGSIFGLFGFYISMIVFRKNLLSKDNRQLIITISVISIIMTFLQPNINITAHLFGLLSGFIIGGIQLRKRI